MSTKSSLLTLFPELRSMNTTRQKGSVELIVMGLIAALIIVLAIPVLQDIGSKTQENLEDVSEEL